MIYFIASFLWSGLEASIFFIVPDVLLTFIVLEKNLKTAFKALVYALAGSLLGGLCIYSLATNYPQTMTSVLKIIPGISESLISVVKEDINKHGVLSFLLGATKGIPYKVYAVEWGMLSKSFLDFIIITIFARGLRFLATIFIAQGLKSLLNKWFKSKKINIIIFLIVWILFYTFYFIHFGW